ncbi:MAG TPA: gliding motility-associated protein GldE [Saprospiraceae bacterium]|nr:gliding motility-associated protein GldE [Saprospiraceae bacterium]
MVDLVSTLTVFGPFLVLLIIFSGLISASEVAYFGLSPKDIADLEDKDDNKSKLILKLLKQEEKLLATILISNNFVNICIVVVSQLMITALLPYSTVEQIALQINENVLGGLVSQSVLAIGIQFFITTIIVTIILLTFGEIAPKIYGNTSRMQVVKTMSGPLNFLTKLFNPFSSILTRWSSLIELRLNKHRLNSFSTSREDIDKAIDLTVPDFEGASTEADILKSIVNFGEISAKQVMKPRVDVIALENVLDFTEMFKIVKDAGYSRLPVYEEDLDHVVGILYVKDLLGHSNEEKDWNWQSLVRSEVLYIPETKKIDQLLSEFQSSRMHMAIVVNEFGGTMGIVTLEDIMEEIIGEIRDEFDTDVEIDFIRLDDENYIFEGKTLLHDICKVIGFKNNYFDDIKQNADSLGGLLVEQFGSIPKAEKEINYKALTFKVISSTERRVEKINLRINKNESNH